LDVVGIVSLLIRERKGHYSMTLSFGKVAHAYDRTRYHPPEVSGKIATAITAPVEESFSEPRFLELGVGTGRVGVPIVARGFSFVGVDISPAMLQIMRHKIAGVGHKVRLLEVDASDLPFAADSFQAVIGVHLWHLLPQWQRALGEALRVLAPGGFLFEGWDVSIADSEDWRIQERWREILAELGYELKRGGHTRRLREVRESLESLGLSPQDEVVAEWIEERSPRQSMEILEDRLYSYTWQVPAEVFRPSIERLWAWVKDTYQDLDQSYPIPWRFVLRTTRVGE